MIGHATVVAICLSIIRALVSSSVLIFLTYAARGEELITAISSDTVWITSNFTGAEIVLFGSIASDKSSLKKAGNYNVIIVLCGPRKKIRIWRKERVAGIWVNGTSMYFPEVKGYLGIFSNKTLQEITSIATLKHYGINLRQDIFSHPSSVHETIEAEDDFKTDLIRLMQKKNLYLENPEGVQFLSDTVFFSRFPMLSNAPTGTYTAHIFLFNSAGKMIQKTQNSFQIRKRGIEELLSRGAKQRKEIYGLLSVLAALGIGWVGALIFRYH
ncbi:MAG: TIGR02186 family protein [Alphaproteobacteria bacterium]|nr:TIGR02186 family protein [Alphaproteobacteria bacterium]